MHFHQSLFLLVATTSSALGSYSPLWTFDGSNDHKVKLVNDPVMGGQSNSDYTVDDDADRLNWNGEVKIVPSLSAPGFCNLETSKNYMDKFPDASGSTHLTLLVKTTTPEYNGFKVSFAADTINPQFKCFKADFVIDPNSVDEETGYNVVRIPYNEFSNNWSSYTGEPIVKCSDDASVCPSEKNKKDIQQLGLWAEGAAGVFNLDLLGFYFETIEENTIEEPTPTLANSDLLALWTFDGENEHEIKLTNDPVMGGNSVSNYTVTEDNFVEWNGDCKIVPSLSAPGFCNLESKKNYDKFPDASGATHLSMLVKSSTPDYKGFKVSFAANTLNPQFKSFKADFFINDGVLDEDTGFTKVSVPFGEFSNNWSSYTGEPIVKCSDDASVCPTEKDKQKIQQLGLWAEGIEGEFNLEILGMYAETVKAVESVKEVSP
ncbi:hypothetical protein TL16_g11911 [Triparma laevis f. inornata]|uniref:NADH:ubiquinone oxidoreductase intermediate-associated protein 30 domain-containing protein n=1 Tax=Triparma laevis f. inornata TaxID=1714386 RepID=A0A9W7BI93_9STRA|nr:hypothetical protein TL16_g11911 [Triparma laevis f. inornata]